MSKHEIPQRLLSEEGAAHYLGMSAQFLRKSRMESQVRSHAQGPPYIRCGRAIRYDTRDLDAWIQTNRVPAGTRCEENS